MTQRDPASGGLGLRLALIGAAIVAMASLVVTLARPRLPHGAVTSSEHQLIAPPAPIAAEAGAFRTWRDAANLGSTHTRRPAAHPRTLAMFQALRAYPGAPPRVPHGLTVDEFRGNRCNTCHRRGGYSQRFDAYAPVTPHPELMPCLQCHATDARVVGVSLPGASREAICRQCHLPAVEQRTAALDWRPAPWPAVIRGDPGGVPPAIPHDLQLRENCFACHVGPGAVAEIRTTHADRTNCRQCHLLTDPEEGFYIRSAIADAAARGVP
jgi:cytochrome c-type protein NapB